MIHYHIMKDRLLNKFRPNSQKDATETWHKIESLHGDHRGWDIYLAALDALVEDAFSFEGLKAVDKHAHLLALFLIFLLLDDCDFQLSNESSDVSLRQLGLFKKGLILHRLHALNGLLYGCHDFGVLSILQLSQVQVAVSLTHLTDSLTAIEHIKLFLKIAHKLPVDLSS